MDDGRSVSSRLLLSRSSSRPVRQMPRSQRRGAKSSSSTRSRIAAVDLATGESGVAVTTRNPCVGNGVPWVRAGVGAVATQASTRTEYGYELLDLMAQGVFPEDALARRLAEDDNAARQADRGHRRRRPVRPSTLAASATGPVTGPGRTYVAQGNTLVGPEVIDAVAESFEATEGSQRQPRGPPDRGLNAGHVLGRRRPPR